MGEEAGTGARTLRIRIDLAYDGTDFSGWAAQPGLRTVEGELSAALTTLLRAPAPVRLTVAGRTDAGVHARGQRPLGVGQQQLDVHVRTREQLGDPGA